MMTEQPQNGDRPPEEAGPETPTERLSPGRYSLLRNWISLLGVLLAACGFLSAIILIVIDIIRHFASPYLGIFTYLVLPMFIVAGLLLALLGAWIERRRRRKRHGSVSHLPVINLNVQRHFLAFVLIVAVGFLFFSLSGVGGYRAYHFTESVVFCGETCHSVMKPEYTAYQNSPHANAKCTTCHIGPGADFFVKAKVNGLYQVYSTIFDKFSRPIPSPVHSLRPAKETCYNCHWPEKMFGAVEMNRTYFRADEENTPWTIRMLINVGGGDAQHGRVHGIHWHMAIANKLEYIAVDEDRMDIPWIRTTDGSGKQTVFQTKDEDKQLTPEDVASAEIRVMDCIDCHNRPTHQFHPPDAAMNEAMVAGLIDTTLPSVKRVGVEALVGEYESEERALEAIRETLEAEYPDGGERVEQAISSIQRIYQRNFFPEMKVDWMQYPDHIGHMNTPGCFRCHDDQHADESGRSISRDCDTCHTIIAQGPGLDLPSVTTGGLEFQHPEDIDEEWKETNCSDCHVGVPVL
jgi:hypothetical protein